MACLGGTIENPLPWIRLFRDGRPERQEYGRVCNRTESYTSRNACSGCVAYRGRRWDTTVATGIQFGEDPYALRPWEYDRYQAALEAQFDDDYAPLNVFLDQMESGVGVRTLARNGSLDAEEVYRAYDRERVAAWRKANPEKAKAQTREAMRRYRARQKVSKHRAEVPSREGD